MIKPDGSIVFRKEQEKYLVTKNFVMPDLPLAVLQKLSIPLIDTLNLPRGSTVINRDHVEYWAWTAEVITQLQTGKTTNATKLFTLEVIQQFGLLVHLLLCAVELSAREASKTTWMHQRDRSTWFIKEFPHTFAVAINSHILSGCLSFPLLETIVRRKCREYVSLDGKVRKRFKGKRTCVDYGPGGRGGRAGRVSNLADELYLLEEQVALPRLREALNELSSKGLYDDLWDWRCTTLHGEKFWTTRSGIVAHVICLILWHEITEEIYNSKLNEIKRAIEWRKSIDAPRACWEFYPP